MSSWTSYPKVYNLGHRATNDILASEVQVQEKVDGSQFSFGVFDEPSDLSRVVDSDPARHIRVRSKGREIPIDGHARKTDSLFDRAINTVIALAEDGQLHVNWTYRGEAITRRKHNVLEYGEVPPGGIVLFDIAEQEHGYVPYVKLQEEAVALELYVVPKLFEGVLTEDHFKALLDTPSILGGVKVEGVVIKPLEPQYAHDGKPVFAKFVSASFREAHGKNSYGKPNKKDTATEIGEAFSGEARWLKAVGFLRDEGVLEGSNRDIGALVKRVQQDVFEEEADAIKDALLKAFTRDLNGAVVKGLPEWYKEQLAAQAFSTEEE